MTEWAGYAWLQHHYAMSATQPLPVLSQIGRDRKTHVLGDGTQLKIFRESARPKGTPAAHLAFALKHEGVHLELLARVFQKIDSQELTNWINEEPSGQYARKTGFLYEWMTGNRLSVNGVTGNYQDILDPDEVIVASNPEKDSRWRINNNLPGTPHFCPMIRRTELLELIEDYDCREGLSELESDYGPELLTKSAVWLTIKESRASFAIEHEGDQRSRIHRFAQAMGRYCGEIDAPLSPDSLAELQSKILGVSTIKHGLRQSPVFVGSGTRAMGTYIHYVAPPADDIQQMLSGLQAFMDNTEHENPIIRAAIASFGFVFIHPMADGNGRISRFLINDTLRRDGAIPEPVLLPVSATITETTENRTAYDQILERYSRPLMDITTDDIHFGEAVHYPDGVRSDLEFTGNDKLRPAWRYPDLTNQSEYMFHVINETIYFGLRHQMQDAQTWSDTRLAVKDVLEGPDEDIDRIIRSIEVNQGRISNKLRKEFPQLEDNRLAGDIVQIVENYIAHKPKMPTYDPVAAVDALRAQSADNDLTLG